MSKLAIGLTGGIGSGKSTVANLFAEHGIESVDADVIAREIVSPNSPALTKLVQHFGQELLLADGNLNRKALREIIFANYQERIWLENLLHPIIRDHINLQAHSTTSAYCLVIIPLLKTRLDYPILDRILVVDAPESLQISRIKQRDNVNEAQAQAILATQLSQTERLKLADDIIINNGDLTLLYKEVNNLHQFYLQLASLK